MLATLGQLSPPGFSRPSPTDPQCSVPRAHARIWPLPFLVHWLWLFRSPWSALHLELRSPCPVVRSLSAATCYCLSPSSVAPFVAVAVVGSARDIQGPQALSPSTKAGSGCGLRARLRKELIITLPRTLSLTRTLSPYLGEEGKGHLDGWKTQLLPKPASAGLPETGAFSIPSAPLSRPFLPRPSPPFPASPWSGLSPTISPTGFGRLTAGPGKTNFLCLEAYRTGFHSPILRQRASFSQRF